MKFELDKNNINKKSFIGKKKDALITDQSYNNIKEIKLYTNLAIYIMEFGTKGNFKEIAKLANDGNEQMSWVIRIYYTNNVWTIQLAINPSLPKQHLDLLTIGEKIVHKNDNLSGNLHLITIKSNYKSHIELLVNYFISFFKEKRIDGIEKFDIIKKYTCEYTTSKFSIDTVKELDDYSYKKNLIIISYLTNKCPLEDDEKEQLIKISKTFFKSHKLSDKQNKIINNLSDIYISQSQKIKIAMNFLK